MPLSNAQYDTIIREYNAKQIKNQHMVDDRMKEVYGKDHIVPGKDLSVIFERGSIDFFLFFIPGKKAFKRRYYRARHITEPAYRLSAAAPGYFKGTGIFRAVF